MKEFGNSILFGTAFYHAPGKSPNAWTISEQSKYGMYYKCMIVFFASLKRIYPHARLVLFTNRTLPAPFDAQLEMLQVETQCCGSRYVDDPAFNNGFPGCLYTLDVIEHLSNSPEPGMEALVLLDSDCIILHAVDDMLSALKNGEAVYAYESGYPLNGICNGYSKASLTLALSYYTGQMAGMPIPLYGGEFLGIPAGDIQKLASRIAAFWLWMKSEGQAVFGNGLTEEHVLSVVLGERGWVVNRDGNLIKRIWTADSYSNVDGTEHAIPIWHLPAEKKKGLARLYQRWLKHNGYSGLSDKEFQTLVDKCIPLRASGEQSAGDVFLKRLRGAARVMVKGSQ